MSNKLKIVCSGKKQSGKSSLCKHIFATFINSKIGQKRFIVEKVGKEVLVVDTFNNNAVINVDSPNEAASHIYDTYSIKIYSFADPLKKFCIEVLGLDVAQCYGTDDDKNSPTHILWDNMPEEIRKKYTRPRRGSGRKKPPTGNMTAREVMQVFGTEICRKLDPNCWARGLYNAINNEGYDLALVTDARFPNEVTMGTEQGAKVIRLTRKIIEDEHESEKALDTFPLGEYSLVVDNQDMTLKESFKYASKYVDGWLAGAKLV